VTFRAWDWGRPASPERGLHVEEAVAVANVDAAPVSCPPPALSGTATATVATCGYFRLELVRIADMPLAADTLGRSFHLVTALDGGARIEAGAETVAIGPRGTALVAGGTGRYRIAATDRPVRLLRASVPA
jgi:mannose-6-phosphate isomerase class I